MGIRVTIAMTMEGKFAAEGLQSIDEDDEMLSAMARELVERNGIGETADAVWEAWNAEHQKLFPAPHPTIPVLFSAKGQDHGAAESFQPGDRDHRTTEPAPLYIFGHRTCQRKKTTRQAHRY